jgi:hypothetical protein
MSIIEIRKKISTIKIKILFTTTFRRFNYTLNNIKWRYK